MKTKNNDEGHTLMTYDQLKNGFKKEEKVEPYPSRKEDNCITNLLCEIKFPNKEPFNKVVRYAGRLRNDEISECIKRDYFLGGWVRKDCTVTVIKITYWNLDYRTETNILIK